MFFIQIELCIMCTNLLHFPFHLIKIQKVICGNLINNELIKNRDSKQIDWHLISPVHLIKII